MTPVPAPIKVQPIVRTRKNVPMNSAIYLFIDQLLADTVWKKQDTSAMRLCSYRPLLRSNLINVDTAIDFIRVETSTIKPMKKLLPLIFSIALSTVAYSESITIAKNTPGFIKKATDRGPVNPNTVIM